MKLTHPLLAVTLLFAITGTSFAQDRVGEIGDTTKIERRVEARDYAAFALGPASLQNMGSDKTGQYVMLGYLWEATPYGAAKVNAHGAFSFEDKNASILAGTIGGNFYFTPTNVSPYVGLEFGYGVAATNDDDFDTVSGWAGGATVGVALFRTSSVQLHLNGSYLQIFEDNGDGHPSQAVGSLGIYF